MDNQSLSTRDNRKQLLGLGLILLLLWSALDYGGRYLHVQAAAQAMTGGLIILFILGQRFWLPIRKFSLLKPILLFYFTLWLSWLFSINQLASLEDMLRYSMYLILPYLIVNWCTSIKERQLMSIFLAALTIIICLISWWFQLTNQQGVSGTFYRTNDLASYLLLLMPLAFHLTMISTELKLKLFYGIASTIALISLIATNSRSAWISLTLPLILLMWFHRQQLRQRSFQIVILLMGSGVLLGLLLNFQSLWNRLQSITHLATENSILWRMSLLRGTWSMFLDHPVVGSGLHTFPMVYPQYQETAGYFSISPHNYYLQLLAETGVLGLFAFIVLMAFIFKELFHQARLGNAISLGIIASLAGSLCHIAFEISWGVSAVPILFFFLVGLGLTTNLQVEEHRQPLLWLEQGLLFFLALFISVLPTMNYFSAQAATRADQHLQEGKYSKVLPEINLAMKLSPWPSARHHFILGSYYFSQKHFPSAAYFTQKALSLNQYESSYYHLAARTLEQQKYHKQALGMLKRAVELNPYKHPELYGLVGDYYMRHQENEEMALEWYQKGEQAFDSKDLARYELYTPGDRYQLFNIYRKIDGLYRHKGNEEKAQEYFKRAELLLKQAKKSPVPNTQLVTPLKAVQIYWEDLQKFQKQKRPLISDSIYEGRTLPYPPGEFKPDKILLVQGERDHTTATLVYQVPFKPPNKKQWTQFVFTDELALTVKGWQIYMRR